MSAVQIVFDDDEAGRRELDVQVNTPAATVADLAQALDPRRADRPLLVEDERLDPDLELREVRLREGAVLRFGEGPAANPLVPPPPPPTAPVPPVPITPAPTRPSPSSLPRPTAPLGAGAGPVQELVVVNGLDAGRRFPLATGTTVIGRAPGCDVVLAHSTVSKRHASLTVDGDGTVTLTDLGSHNGTWLDGVPLTEPAVLDDGVPFRLGALELEVRHQHGRDRPVTLDPWRDVTVAGTIPFNRPPRSAPPPPPTQVTVPQPPRATAGKGSFSLITVAAPIVFAGAMYMALHSVHVLLFAGLSPIMAIANAIEGKRRGRKSERTEKERYRRELDELRGKLRERVDEERQRRRTAYPDPVEIARRVTLPSTTLWERRPFHDDFLQLRLGVGEVPWEPPVSDVEANRPPEVAEAVEEASTLPGAALPIDLAGGGVVGIVGDRDAAVALARSLLGQAAVLHGPADLPVMVLTTPEASVDWDWAKWLPHTRGPSGVDRMLSADRELSTRLVEGRLGAEGAAPSRRGRATPAFTPASTRPDQRATGPTLLVVVDDEALTTGRVAPTRNLLRGEGGLAAGIVIARSADRLPALCTAVVEMDGPDGQAHLYLPRQGRQVRDFLACGLSDDVARECARALAGYEDPELDLVGAGLPTSIRLLSLLELDECTPEAVRARWKRSAHSPLRVATPIGANEHGAFLVDLVADGPHGLVGGTTGAGKSELLRTLVAGLAATFDPDHLTFVLIDFKGGSAFDECGKLPHTVGLVTDLDEHLAERALRCLEAELKHRERLLRQAGAVDLPEYLRSTRAPEPLPRLLVVIDEFATLRAELPDFIDALVGVAQRGRSLGVHLLLATQRPQGAISENIKANTNLRIALRVQGNPDSVDIIGVPDAAGIPRTTPGRAYVRLGHDEVVAIQTALSTGIRSETALAPIDLAPFVYGPTARVVRAAGVAGAAGATKATEPVAPGVHGDGDGDSDGDRQETDLSVLVRAITEAFAATDRPQPRRPWPDPLPDEVDLDEVIARAGATSGPDARRLVPLAMADDPDGQAQYPVGWTPADGNLVLYGIGGSGTTTALSSLALSLAHMYPADDLHLYVLDLGARELEALAPLPHVGGVITAGERERQIRLVRHLRDELDRRRQLGIAALDREPMIVTLIDGWSTLVAEYNDITGTPVMDSLVRVVTDGPEARMYTVIAAERPNAVSMQIAATVRQRLVLRLSDRHAYTSFGIRLKAVPEMAPGRALMAGSGQVVQIARPAGGVEAAVASIVAGAGAGVAAPDRPPPPIRTLASVVRVADLGRPAQLGERPWEVPIGIAEQLLAPTDLVAFDGEHALIAGPARSGKTSALLTIATVCRESRPDMAIVAVAGPRSRLWQHQAVDTTIAPGDLGQRLPAEVEVGSASPAGTLVLIDDADAVDDVGGILAGLSTSDRSDLLVVAAGSTDGLRAGLTHWTKQLRRSKLGVLLVPNVDYDGDLLGTKLPRRAPVGMTAGRGYLVNGGRTELVQLALPHG